MRDPVVQYLLATLVFGLLAFLIVRASGTTPRRGSSDGDYKVLTALHRDLLTKMGHDKAAVERIVSGLRRKHPGEPLASIYERAIQDWLKDNNRS